MPTKLSSKALAPDAVTVDNIPDGEISAAKLTPTAIADHVGQSLTSTSDVTFGSVTAPLTGDVTGTVSDISNHSTSDLVEGTNLYYTNARVQTQIAAVTPPGGFVGNTQLTNALNTKLDVTTFDANIDQAVKTTSNVIFADISASGNITLDGNLTVNGTTTTVNAQTLSVADNMVYLNEGSSQTNPDLGWAGNYNDGTYAHAGIFRDATDGTFKVFHGYTPEPGAAIDITHASFTLAPIASGNLSVTGNISVSGTVDGRDVASDGTKLDGIEAGATGDQTASEILTLIKTVDGSGSGLDADLWDGNQFDSYLNQAVLTTSSPSFESGTTVKGGFRVTETGTAQHILVGNQDSGGVNKPAMLRGVNGSLHLGYGDSWVGEGGTMTQVMTITGSSGTSRVGINNSSPAYELHVIGSEYAGMFETNSSADGTAIRLAIKSPASQGQVELDWFNDSSRTGGGYSMIQVGKSSYASDLALMASRVGVGTSNPQYKLHVSGDTKTTSVYTDAGATYGYRLHSNSGIVASNNYMSLFTSQTNGWGFLSNGTGTDATPVALIDLTGSMTLRAGSSGSTSNGKTSLRITGLSDYDSLELGVKDNYQAIIKTYGNDLNYYSGHWKTAGLNASENHSHYWYTSRNGSSDWSNYKMDLNHNGRLRIINKVSASAGAWAGDGNVLWLKNEGGGSASIGMTVVDTDGDHHRAGIVAISRASTYSVGGALEFYTRGPDETQPRMQIDYNGYTTVGAGGSIGSAKFSVRAGGASGVSWNTGISLGDSSNYTGWIQDNGYCRWRNNGNGVFNWFNQNATRTMEVDANGNFWVAGTVTEASSRELKENIRPITGALESIIKLQGVVYDRIDGSAKDEPGLIAEDTLDAIANLVVLDEDGKAVGVKYTKTVAYLIEAVKELTERVKVLENK